MNVKIDKDAISREMVRLCMDSTDLSKASGIEYGGLRRILRTGTCRSRNAGYIARALGVEPEAILLDEPKQPKQDVQSDQKPVAQEGEKQWKSVFLP